MFRSFLLITMTFMALSLQAQKKAPKGMRTDAVQIAKKMRVGWNLGNTLEAYNSGQGIESETSWGNPRTTKEMIDSVAAAGFGAVRIPVRWYPHFTCDGHTLTIDPAWMNRVKEIVGYCLDNHLYVIINSHHETWLEGHPTYADSARVYNQLRLMWTEIAKAFQSYDEHVLFAGTNEVHVGNNWGEPTAENAVVQNGYNQQFINAVRATGGNNRWRTLVVQTYVCNASFGLDLFKMPTDPTRQRLMVEVHNYDPYKYGLTDEVRFWGTPYQQYGTNSNNDEAELAATYRRLKDTFTDKGIPFVVGEMGANYHTYKDAAEAAIVEASCNYYYEKVLSTIRQNGGIPFIWDNGVTGRRGQECFGLFDRRNHMRSQHPGVIKAVKGLK